MLSELPTFERRLSASRVLFYSLIKTEAVCLKSERFPYAYSILIIETEEGAVTDSTVLYDVSRICSEGAKITERLAQCGVTPLNAKRTVSSIIGE